MELMFSFTTIENYHAFLKETPDGCLQAVRYYLARIADHASLNAYLEVFSEEAEARAAELDKARQAGAPMEALHGVVIALKDVIAYKGHTLSAGSKMLEGFTSLFNATAVDRLLAEGAIIIGRNNCDEFAMGSTNENSAYGLVRNALDPNRVPGGSSGGSAVAVQADLCMLSLGSDTGGSVRQPADFCGIIGYKPTYGAISRYGLVAYGSSLDQIGIFGKVIEDVARVLAVIGGPDDYDSTALSNKLAINIPSLDPSNIRPPRVAYFREAIAHPSLDPEIRYTLQKFIDTLQQDGAVVEAVPFDLLDFIVPAYYVLSTAEASSNLSRYDGVKYGHQSQTPPESLDAFYKANRSSGFGREVQRRILLGTFVLSAGYYDAYFTKAQQVRKLLVDKTNEVFQGYDALILPTAPTPAFPLGSGSDDPIALYLADIYTVFANLTGLPGISLPLFQHTNGMPFGLQVLSDRGTDSALLQLSFNWLSRYRA
ncbi:Asp-tRNA(Asn)/Glu-tRNA(Gln) amidotransferase subunit GatA [Dinghuibacter silviterrae]|uniref:Glutamyl-tRNA(Gln) amidotransferase subunit A n=1 Tax=Dinghuibacter silviterrae TaxID=1539049 RepID=A0A4R8DSS9_9BACT|nr:Asp-tRNA(Asn)/Glu-tRNA(Gln) amidotransferase subunit GatA [Dinghuibacter silviterrae]TDX00211.1 aspartyl/glutamyl-tRNA(Asn/Gln) amidotransferase subunit A [Dinghuibacter silviterrae]